MSKSTQELTSTPLHILIVGGGIGGLTAAIALREQGHQVSVFEQSRLSQETSAAVHVAPNCNSQLRRLGLDVEALNAVEVVGFSDYAADGHLKQEIPYGHCTKTFGYAWLSTHRQVLHTSLREMATSEDGEGEPAKLQLSSKVQSVDPETATIYFQDGTSVQGDLIIGADGVHSKTRKAIPGGDLAPFDSGTSAYRFMIPTEKLASDPLTVEYVSKTGFMVMWTKGYKRIVMYPCNEGKAMNFVVIHPSSESANDLDGERGWQKMGNKEGMLEVFRDFAPSVKAVLDKTDEEHLKLWNLLDMEKMPAFVEGRLAVLGDAGHPFLPHQGQGAGQAIEDAISLGVVLPRGTSKAEIPNRLKLYEKCRYERSHTIQNNTRAAADGGFDSGNHVFTDDIKYNFGHNEWEYSSAMLREYLQQA